jgi:hypothetical protein
MPTRSKAWRTYTRRDRDTIEAQMEKGHDPRCPLCETTLAMRDSSRMAALLPPHALGYDLECHPCRRYHSRVQLTSRSLHVLRLNRLAAAVLRA